ncbi:MAG: hypothetical protein AAF399_22845 [Bacteroidota bacterium]
MQKFFGCWYISGMLLGCFLLPPLFGSAQSYTELLAGQRIGVYFSGQGFSFSDQHRISIGQFIQVDNTEAWQGRLKSEFLVQLGWLFSEQLQYVAKADTVLFLNADPKLGQVMQEKYLVESQKFRGNPPELAHLDWIIVVNPMNIGTRIHKSVFIRSNRMISERVPVSVGNMTIALHDPERLGEEKYFEVCFDKQKSKPPTSTFDFHRSDSPFGRFLSHWYSQWWEQMRGEAGLCEE